MGTQGDEKPLHFSNHSLWKRHPPLCHLDRSEAQWRDLCVDALSWECFSTRSPKVMKSRFTSATTLSGGATLPFVISTEAKRSGEISVWMLLLGNVIRPESRWAPKVMKSRFTSATTLSGSATLPFVISTGAQRSGEISVWMLLLGNVCRPEFRWAPKVMKSRFASATTLSGSCHPPVCHLDRSAA